ncbi:MAG: hypothetical protein SH868_20345 [Bythopirellula sp.]|nr:hypothetical protein [Bythopirellula sp.]
MPFPNQQSENLIFDGALALPTAIIVGLLLVAFTTWLLIRDRRAIGMAWATLFWFTRLAAVGLALWMAVGPTIETIERSSTPQSVAIIADQSESMNVVDPPDGAEEVRWNLAAERETSDPQPGELAMIAADRAAVALAVAHQHCETTTRLLAEHRPLDKLRGCLESVRVAVGRAGMHCETISSELAGSRDDIVERLARVETLIEGPIAESLDAAKQAVTDRSDSAVEELTTSLGQLSEGLSGAQRRIDSLASDLLKERVAETSETFAAAENQNRREKTVEALQALERGALTELPDDVRVNRFRFDALLTAVSAERAWENDPQSEEPDRPVRAVAATNLSGVLEQLTKARTADATRLAVIYTDGRHTTLEGAAPQEVAAELNDLPVFVVPVGSAALVRDLVVHRVSAPSTVVERDSAVIEAIVTAFDSDGLQSEIVLRHEGKIIDRKPLEFTGDRIDRRVQFDVYAEQLGWQEYELALEPVDGEASQANNVTPVSWEVVKDKFRVLLSDGVSQWEYRYLQQLFRRDPHVECDELLFFPRLRGTGNLATKPQFPRTVDDWAMYDVVILGDISPRQLPRVSQEALVEYVRKRNGHLILIAGRDHLPQSYEGQPLMELLPVEAMPGPMYDSYTVSLTDEGRVHSALAIEDGAKLSEMAWQDVYDQKPLGGVSVFCKPKATARTLIEAIPYGVAVELADDQAQQAAFLCWHQVGAGKVVYLASPQTWKLRFRRDDRRHHRFWGQMLRWITATNLGSGFDLVRLSTDQTHYAVNEPVEVTVWLKDQTGRPLADQEVQVAARVLDETVSSVPLVADEEMAGRYTAALKGLAPGAYEILVEGSVVDQLLSGQTEQKNVRSLVSIESSDSLEMMDTRCDRALLEQIAKTTGGRVVPPTAVAEVLQLASLSPEVHENIERTPLWDRWANLWIILGCLFVEWIVRKAKGFV